MIKNFVKILELLGDRLEVCVSVLLVDKNIKYVYSFSLLDHKEYLVINCLALPKYFAFLTQASPRGLNT